MRTFRSASFLICVLVLSLPLMGAPPAVPTSAPVRIDKDPMEWVEPAIPPQLPEAITGDEYAKSFAEALKGIDPKALSQGPGTGVLILTVEADSVAEGLGLKAGDYIVALDGQEVNGDADWSARHKAATEPVMARIWSSSENKLKLVMLPVGILGITAGDHWQPLRQYMLSLPRDAKPRDEMLVAAVTYQTNPKLAETALAHAAAAGEKGAMFHALAAEAAFYDLRFDDSLVFGNIAMKEKPDQAWQLARLMNGIALQTFHWKLAIDLRHRFPNAWLPPANGTDSEEVVESMTDAFEGMPVDEMPNPVEAFSKLKYADHAADIEAMNVQYAYAPEYCTKELRKNHALKIAITDGKYVDLHIGPSAANVDFSCTARLRQGDDNHSGWDKLMHFGLAEEPTGDVPLLFYINVNLNGTICVGNRNTISTFGLNSAIQFNKPFSVRVAAVGNRCEVVINGIRIFYGPLLDDEGTRHLSPFMHFQGMSCNVSDIVYRTAGPGGH